MRINRNGWENKILDYVDLIINMLIFFIVCLGYGKLILQGTQTNECKIYITEIEENS